MRRFFRWAISVVLIFLIAGAAIWTFQRLTRSVSSVVDRGVHFLAGSYGAYRYADPYLSYVYPGEALTCPLAGCHLTYRVLDAFFDVTFLLQGGISSDHLGAQAHDSTTALKAILPEWRKANLTNTIVGAGKDGVALDTTCIIGYVEQDRPLAEHIATFLTPEGNLLSDTLYTNDVWRNIADETWCIRLFKKTNVASDRIPGLLQTKIDETRSFLAGNPAPTDQLAVLYHMAYMLSEIPDAKTSATLATYLQQLAKLAETPDLQNNAIAQANVLEALSIAKYDDRAILQSIARRLIRLQRQNGSWSAAEESSIYPVFATFRATIALNTYLRFVSKKTVE